MPCSHGYEEIDARRRDALVAMLCGVLCQKQDAIRFAHEWFVHHRAADEARRRGFTSIASGADYDAGKVLDAAYPVLCK